MPLPNRSLRLLATMSCAVLAACESGRMPTGEPPGDISWLFLYGPSVMYVGDSSRAVVHLRNADSVEIDPATRRIRWTVSSGGVATVDSTGMIRALAVGSALLRVQVDDRADTLRFSVETPPPPPPPRDTMILSYPYSLGILAEPHMLPGDTVTTSIGVYAPPVGLRWTDTLANFSASPTSVGAFSGGRMLIAKTPGTVTISASYRGLTASRPVSVLAPPDSWAEFRSVSIGLANTCGVLKVDGTLLCWGSGNPYGSPYGTPRAPMQALSGVAGFVWNTDATCGLLSDGTLRCGSFSSSWSGPPSAVKWRSVFRRAPDYIASTCGLLTDSTAACWYGSDSIVPQAGGMRFLDLGAGAELCGIRTDSTAVCWERGATTQTPVAGLTRLVKMASGGSHQCFLDADRILACVGSNESGQLGDGTTSPRAEPYRPMGATPISAVFAEGGARSCALDLDGAVWCWGGVAGIPTLVPTSTGFTNVTIGLWHTCGLKGDGSAWCWGSNIWGRIGDGTAIFRQRPSRVRGSYPP